MCPPYKSGECPGCHKLAELHGRCEIAECAKSKQIRYCFNCEEFPCKLFEEGFDWNLDEIPEFKEFKLGTVKWKPYSDEYIRLFKLGKEESKK